MLNTKYFIVQNENPAGAAINPSACGNAWFVTNIKKVSSADEEMQSLANFDPLETAIVDKEYEAELYSYSFGRSQDATINLMEMSPKYLKYTAQNQQDGLAVFSEIYYQNGWKAFIDDEPADIYRVNYTLRAIKIPAGTHEVEMRFEPASYRIGMNISMAGSVLFLLFAGGMLYFYRKQGNGAKDASEEQNA